MTIGLKTLESLVDHIPESLPVKLHEQEHRFRSVHGKSSTKMVASIPTSVGKKGSYFKPAIFENAESQHAPFLISLPFMLACRTTLILDPEVGLKAHFNKLGVTIPCHVGPTGALRIPLCKFSQKQMDQLKNDYLNETKGKEFEVLRTEVSGPSNEHRDPSTFVPQHHGAEPEEIPRASSAELDPVDVALHGSQDDLHHGEVRRDPALHGTTWSSSSTPHGGDVTQDFPTEKEGNIPVSSQQHQRGSEHLGSCGRDPRPKHDHPRDLGHDGNSTTLRAHGEEQALCELHRGQQSAPVLALLSTSQSSVQLLPMDQGPAPDRVPEVQEGISIQQPIDPNNVSTPERVPFRNECLPHPREVQGLPRGAHRPEDREGHSQGQGEAGATHGEVPLPPGANGSCSKPFDTGNGTKDSTVRSSGEGRNLDRSDRPVGNTVEEMDLHSLGNKRGRRLLKQARTALGEAHDQWVDLMTCFLAPSANNQSCLEQFLCTIDTKEDRDQWGPRKIHRLSKLLGIKKSKVREVAELFNPNRFGPRTKKWGLQQGKAFDLELGHDIRKEGVRRTIRQYINTQKPGLVCASPPCTFLSIMQNMANKVREQDPQKKKEFQKNLAEAKLLLSFAIEICHTVHEYGGTFVFEHPWTSKAWHDHHMTPLLERDDIFLVKNHQCMFGLVSPEGKPHLKPTGWLTNNRRVATDLQQLCDGKHIHQPILGSINGIRRSEHAARYPRQLLDRILSSYAQTIDTETCEIHLLSSNELLESCLAVDTLWQQLEHTPELEVLANEEEAPMAEAIAEEDLLPDHAVVPVALPAELQPEPQEGDGPGQGGEEDQDEGGERRLPLQRPMGLEQLVRRAHCGLGHISNDRLASILKHAKAKPEAIQLAKKLTCSTCQQHRRVDPARKAAPPRLLKPNQVVGVDTVWLPGVQPNKQLKMALNCVCWSTRFQMMIPLRAHTPQATCEAFYQWIRIFGPPEKVYCDLGKEFKGAFRELAAQNDFLLDPGALEAPTQRSITERAGRTFKEILSKTLMETGCNDWDEWRNIVDIVNATVNRLTNKSGFSPMQRMLGFNPRLPGSLLSGGESDMSSGSRYVAGDAQIQRAMEIRKQAAIAYHEADCSQALRHAIHSGPKKLHDFTVGQTVYFWRKGMERAKKDSPAFWHGPAKVVLTDLPSTVFCSSQQLSH